jgi:hypothetical protein
MQKPAFKCWVWSAVLLGLCGCANPGRIWQAMKPGDYSNPTDEAGDPWIRQAAVEARGDRPREYDEEPAWFHNLVTSEKYRAVEENMGVYTR